MSTQVATLTVTPTTNRKASTKTRRCRVLTLAAGFICALIHQIGLCDSEKSLPLVTNAQEIISQARSLWNLSTVIDADTNLLANQYRALETTGKKVSLVVKDQLSNGMMSLLRGEGHSGADRFSPGMSYQAIWSSKYILVEAKYQF